MGAVEDEAKFLCDTGAFCPSDSRLRKRRSCMNPTALNLGNCDPVSGYATGIESHHATNVTSVASVRGPSP